MQSLENQFLIAMPSMGDPFFNKTVTYICEHNDEGAMGLIINLPVNICLNDLLKQIDDEADSEAQVGIVDDNHLDKQQKENSSLLASLEQPVLSGGPISQNRGFVLHSTQQGWKSSLALSKDIMITTSKDVLASLTTAHAPEQFIITLGYAGWEQGQLEQELLDNSWLIIEADPAIIFNTPAEKRWEKAVSMLGFDIGQLSPEAGHA